MTAPPQIPCNCTLCHAASGSGGVADSVTEAHDWMAKDARNIPEFDVDLTVSTPANGTHFVAGESPVISVVLNEDGTPIDHTTVIEDTDGDEGCAPEGCPDRDGAFDRVYLLVHGPRARRNPVLSTAARAEIVATGGPYDLTGAESLDLVVDGGKDLLMKNPAGRDAELTAAAISVEVDPDAFAAIDAATDGEIVEWLNGDSAFAARAIADTAAGGEVAIRSRNLGDFFSVQLEASDVTTQVFGGDTDVYVPGQSYPRNNILQHADPAEDDPKAAWTTGAITYTLDPVDDLEPGTYVASVEITDRGRVSSSNYKTPSVAKVTFQVGTPDEEFPPAGDCGLCHQGPDGTGFVLDFLRHYKIFDDTAVDQCGGCHDYQNRYATGEWEGARPIAKRVHAVHHGSELNYPNTTVDYTADPVAGRSWQIEFPQDIRNCDTTCHPDATSSGSWAFKAARLPCSGCHDADAATAHMKIMTWDPTPESPWNGDEEESCQTCH